MQPQLQMILRRRPLMFSGFEIKSPSFLLCITIQLSKYKRETLSRIFQNI